MNISELMTLLKSVQDNYGDMPVGAYSAEYCYELAKPDDMMGIALRVLVDHSNLSATNLPGFDPKAEHSDAEASKFLTIFYLDRP